MNVLGPKIGLKKMATTCRKLATAYDAGIPLVQSLQIIRRDINDRETNQLLSRIEERIKQGASLTEAVSAEGKYTPQFFTQMLSAGETGGKLDVMLNDLADYYEDSVEQRRQIIRFATYPVGMLISAWVLGTFALGIANRVVQFFEQQITFMDYVQSYIWFQAKAGIIMALVVLAMILAKRAGILNYMTGIIGAFVWPIKMVIQRFALARFLRSMSLLVNAGLPLRQCIKQSAALVTNPFIAKDLAQSADYVGEGTPLDEALAQSRFMLPMAREMVAVGEQAGKTEQQLRKASDYCLEEARHAVDITFRMLRGVTVVAIGALVFYIMYTFYMTYYGSLFDAISSAI